ncbi:MAG TPA: chromate efflux transporter [Noviherbaspirillum sp.]
MHASGAGQCPDQVSLAKLWWIFLRIACTSFGGFMTMISVVQNVVVTRRRLLRDQDVLDGLSLASALPGPLAINVVAYVGYRLRGAAGAAVCVCAAVLPAFVLMTAFSFTYLHWGHIPAVGKVFIGVTPAVAAIIAVAAWRMCGSAANGVRERVLASGAALAMLAFPGIGVTLGVTFVAGIAGWRWFRSHSDDVPILAREPSSGQVEAVHISDESRVNANLLAAAVPLIGLESALLFKLFYAFAGMSMLMFGGGYVFIPLLQQAVVEGHHWVTQQEFVDAVALGQMTPGPVVISATFIGFKVAGLAGAVAATVGVFAPTAGLTVLCASLLGRASKLRDVQAALHGVRAAAVGMVIAAAVLVGKSAVPSWISVALFISVLVAQLRYRVDAAWLVPAAGFIGFVAY